MSIFSKIEGAEHTFAAWFEGEMSKLVKVAPTFFTIADNVLAYSGPIIVTVLDDIPATAAAGAEAQVVLNQSLADITVLRGVLEDAGPTLTTKSLLTSIQANLQSLLTAEHITNPVSVALVNKVLGELAALLAAFPAASPALTSAPAAPTA